MHIQPVAIGQRGDVQRLPGRRGADGVVGRGDGGATTPSGDWEAVRSRWSANPITPFGTHQPGMQGHRGHAVRPQLRGGGQGQPVVRRLGHAVGGTEGMLLACGHREGHRHHQGCLPYASAAARSAPS
ncbi:hypothetical protein [Streptomyces gilvus]|uniref:hypothetical protein n=1 Tax=Streptomyces gilvus TaxID=2920937 RepID=UPI001F0E7AAD|nr:hypothetical protein [Streptomyces sp. CME 23]MCH5676870.1 hypothetical protein [Streptomyces sp. CME 23]